jgi:formamidopyrimidine-DNA glycosylase
MRLIDAEKTKACIQNVVEHLAEAGNEVMAVALSFAIEMIDNAKTIDPVKHGKWENVGHVYHRCSVCKQDIHSYTALNAYFCPNCGADMRGDQK